MNKAPIGAYFLKMDNASGKFHQQNVRKAPKGAFKNVYQAAFFSNNAALFSISLIIFFNSKDNAKSLSNFVLKVILAILFPFMITTKWDDL